MNTILTRKFVLYGILFPSIFISCNFFDPEIKTSRKLETGKEVEVATQTITTSGGTLVVNATGSEIDGMEIIVPPGSYDASRTFKVSTANIVANKLGEYFNPITPLILIDNGGGYADSVMEVTIRIVLPEGHFAMAFYYDEVTGSLEGIPLLELTPSSITFATRHFMPAKDLHFDESELKGSPVSFNASSNLLICSISESLLMKKSIISTGFKPGIDDYEFPNPGSYIAPKGICAGQSITMMWYYYERKLNGSPALFSEYDAVDNLWQDNPYYYRFASVIQKDVDWDGNLYKIFLQIRNNEQYNPLSWKAFALSMLLTGHPQYVGLGGPSGGHAILTHKISPSEGILYVTDPNYPGQERQIKFENNKFSPYNTVENTNVADPLAFTKIGYRAVSAMIDWDKITERYQQVLDSTIGNVAPNTFPEYRILIKSEKNSVLQNGHVSETDTIRFIVECPNAERFTLKNGMKLISFDMYNEAGILDEKWDNPTISSLKKLKPGLNKVGFYIYGQKNGGGDANHFIDFKWFDIYYSQMKINPDPITGLPNDEITLTAEFVGPLPAKARFVWNFGDDTKEVTVKNDPTVKHKFAKEGVYDVRVTLYDDSNNTAIGFATAQAKIGEPSKSLQEFTTMVFYDGNWASYMMQSTYDGEETLKYNISELRSRNFSCGSPGGITWNDNNFSMSLSGTGESPCGGGVSNQEWEYRIEGKVSSDLSTLQECTFYQKMTGPPGEFQFRLEMKLSIVDFPLIGFDESRYTYRLVGSEIGDHVKEIIINYGDWKLKLPHDWGKNEISIEFQKP